MFERYHRELLSFLSRRVGDGVTAADLVQESYLRVYAACASGTVIDDPRAWLYRTARNLVVDHHRRGSVRAEVMDATAQAPRERFEAAGPAGLEPEAALSSRQGVAAMVAAIDALPPRCREAFVLYKFDGLSYGAVAERMGISVRTVEMHLQIAMKACWRCLDDVGERRG